MSEQTPEITHTRCQERSPITGLPCTRPAEHQGEEYGGLCMSGDGNCWTNDPWRGQPEKGESLSEAIRRFLERYVR